MNPLLSLVVALILLDVMVARVFPIRWVERLVRFPIGKARRFRFTTPEGNAEAATFSPMEQRLEPTFALSLRVTREAAACVRVERSDRMALVRLRARWIGDELVVSGRYWPGLFTLGPVLLLVVVWDPERLVAATSLALLTGLFWIPFALAARWNARYEADVLIRELLELAKPWPTAVALELDARDRVSLLVGPPLPRTVGMSTAFAVGGATLAAMLCALLGVTIFALFPRTFDEGALALLIVVVFGLLTLLALAVAGASFYELATGRKTLALPWKRHTKPSPEKPE